MENTSKSKFATGKRYLRVNNIVRRFDVSERTVRYWAAKGLLGAVRLGQKIWGFDPDEVEAFERRRRAHEVLG